jgi:hypothetical protein
MKSLSFRLELPVAVELVELVEPDVPAVDDVELDFCKLCT